MLPHCHPRPPSLYGKPGNGWQTWPGHSQCPPVPSRGSRAASSHPHLAPDHWLLPRSPLSHPRPQPGAEGRPFPPPPASRLTVGDPRTRLQAQVVRLTSNMGQVQFQGLSRQRASLARKEGPSSAPSPQDGTSSIMALAPQLPQGALKIPHCLNTVETLTTPYPPPCSTRPLKGTQPWHSRLTAPCP